MKHLNVKGKWRQRNQECQTAKYRENCEENSKITHLRDHRFYNNVVNGRSCLFSNIGLKIFAILWNLFIKGLQYLNLYRDL